MFRLIILESLNLLAYLFRNYKIFALKIRDYLSWPINLDSL